MSLCPVARCQVTITDDRNVCAACAADLEQQLAEIPALVEELERTLARLRSGPSGPRSAEKPLPYDEHASRALGALKAVLVGWTRDLEPDPRRQPRDTSADIARWLLARLPRLLGHPAAADICTEVEDAVTACRRAQHRSVRARITLPERCPEPDCAGALHATMHDVGDPRPNLVWCDGAERHEWRPEQWLRLGHRLGYGRTA